MNNENEKPNFAGGKATSSHVHPYRYIPSAVLDRLAQRFVQGRINHKDQAWNGISENYRIVNADKEWTIARLEHTIKHAKIAIDKICGVHPRDGDDDAGAILFGGATLVCSDYDPVKIVGDPVKTAGRLSSPTPIVREESD